jgi:signal transduction histidine kinase
MESCLMASTANLPGGAGRSGGRLLGAGRAVLRYAYAACTSAWQILWRLVRRLTKLVGRWTPKSLAAQFLIAGGVVSFAAMGLVGAVVASVIEDGVTRNSAAATALYVDSVIAPILPDMQKSEFLTDPVTRALDETLGQGALGKRLMSFRLWRRDGTILYSKNKALTGKRFEPNPSLRKAFAGTLVAKFDQVDDVESQAERDSGQPLLEIYVPVLQPWSGEVVAVSEFYELASELERTLFFARLWGWLAVACATLAFFLMLSAIVFRGSRMIAGQSAALSARVLELSELLAQNRSLRGRIQRASERVVALNEGYLRRIGADLHDGPAQLVALAAMKLDDPALTAANSPREDREREIGAIRSSLDDALDEIRSICGGLILPHIETAQTAELITHAARAHEQRTGTKVHLALSDQAPGLSASGKICIYRFVQEALGNSYRHAGGAGQAVRSTCEAGRVVVEVSDCGPGFDPQNIRREALGLAGLRQRVKSLGGSFAIETSERGTTLTMALNLDEARAA